MYNPADEKLLRLMIGQCVVFIVDSRMIQRAK